MVVKKEKCSVPIRTERENVKNRRRILFILSALSVRVIVTRFVTTSTSCKFPCSLKGGDPAAPSDTATLLRLHPSHRSYLRRLPPLRVSSPTLGTPNSHGVTGGVYKTRERIHPDMLIRDY